MSLNQLAIRTDVYQPKIVDGKATNLLEFVEQKTFKEIDEQFIAVLKNINVPSWDHSAHGGAEYISFHDYDQDPNMPLPKGQLFVMVCEGNCEGYRLNLLLQCSENNHLIHILAAKYLSDRDEVWDIAKKVDEAIQHGLYGY